MNLYTEHVRDSFVPTPPGSIWDSDTGAMY